MKVLRTPRLLKLMFDEASEEYEVVADETAAPQPGGYNWGEGPQQPQQPAQEEDGE